MESESSVGGEVLLAVAALHPVVGEGNSTNGTEETPELRQRCASSLLHLRRVVFHKAGGVCQDGATHAAHKLARHLEDEDQDEDEGGDDAPDLLLHHDGDSVGGDRLPAELAKRFQLCCQAFCSLLSTKVT